MIPPKNLDLKTMWIIFTFYALQINASTSFPFIIYSLGANVFLCIHADVFSPTEDKETQVLFRKNKKILFHVCSPYTLPLNATRKALSRQRGIKIVCDLFFNYCRVFHVRQTRPFLLFSRANLHKVLWRLRVQTCFNCWSLASHCYSGTNLRYLQTSWISLWHYKTDRNHIKTALS